jgi:V8-like Glu-specific endopeptidase
MTSTRIRATLAALVTSGTALAVMGAAVPQPDPPDSSGGRWHRGPVKTVGKLVAKLPGNQAESCSAAIVDSPNGSVVATAAHCVLSPERPHKPQALYFQPGYSKGGGPKSVVLNGWRVASWKVAPRWDVRKKLDAILPYDWAFLRMGKRGGRTIQQTYGANRLKFAPVGDGRVTTLGYPVTKPYDGESLNYCAGNAHVYRRGEIATPNVGALTLKPCHLTQGVSGGPWLREWDATRRTGTVVGVTSVGTQDELLARPFPEAAKAVFRQVGGDGHRHGNGNGNGRHGR